MRRKNSEIHNELEFPTWSKMELVVWVDSCGPREGNQHVTKSENTLVFIAKSEIEARSPERRNWEIECNFETMFRTGQMEDELIKNAELKLTVRNMGMSQEEQGKIRYKTKPGF